MVYSIEITIRLDDGTENRITKLARNQHPLGDLVKHNIITKDTRMEAVEAAIRMLEIEQLFLEDTQP